MIRAAMGVAMAAALLATPALAPHAMAQDDPAVQRGVPAEATAENAVVAKERAIANAQRLAYQRYAAATGANPNASASQIESQIQSMVVEQERSTLNGYSGRYTIRFRGGRPSGGGGGDRATAEGALPPLGGPAPSPLASLPPSMPLTAYLEAGANFRSLDEWLLLRRRLLSQPSVGSLDILAISTEGARLRLGLRSPPNVAAQDLAGGGIVLAPIQPISPTGLPSPITGPAWRVGLAGGA
ncbi:hypothetical protein [Roseomonas xinghualingensis]|uniref:hypothetical protein n=1 Tax=Roseomonas xinghualingensis TaxID=2986475 RepID=UPI0021F202B9|nr:hypothetical protein [Roseomonas sp. SXEYE001]MCV4208832.1 hypothetical protein [Roseomonas sp. SXEYE001]